MEEMEISDLEEHIDAGVSLFAKLEDFKEQY